MAEPLRRVLSIQSHVVSGYVGNKAATFPLQVLGFDVDAINTVHFSNHTGYPTFAGKRLSAEELSQVAGGLERNGLLQYSHVLTGYVGSAEALEAILVILGKIREVHPGMKYVCDPVLGDNGKLYVPKELVSIYAERVLPHAYVITPNQFEAELLSGVAITSLADARACVDVLCAKGPKIVVITSVELGSSPGLLHVFLGHALEGGVRHYRCEITRLECPFSGTGDLFTALILAGLERYPGVVEAAEAALSSIRAVLERTLMRWRGAQTVAAKELAIVQSKADFESPVLGAVKFLEH